MNTLIVGGDGGIGSELSSRLAKDPSTHLNFATSRNAEVPEAMNVSWLPLELESDRSIEVAIDYLRSSCSRLDLVIFATGYLHGDRGTPEKSIKDLESSRLMHSYRVNVAGPLAVFRNCLDLVKSAERPVVVFLSAQVGSIEDNKTGGWYSYRMSKAALNMAVKSLSLECARFKNESVVVAIHPGTTMTKLSEPFLRHRKKPVREAGESAAEILELVKELGPQDSGKFFTTKGETIPW